MTGREDIEKDKVVNEGSKKAGKANGVKKRRREDDRREDTEKDKMMIEGSKKAGKASDRGEEEKEGR